MSDKPALRNADIDALERKYAEERDKRLRPDASDQYAELEGKFVDYDRDPNADLSRRRAPLADEVEALIIGGGFGGLLVASRLREKGVEKLRIIEKGADFGGTWYWNRYPGAACDVESYIYLPMLEELGYLPSEKYAKGPEIRAHVKKLAERYDLYSGALFQTQVLGARWDEARLRWIVSTDHGDKIATRFLISCTGLLSKPKLPRIPGIESFTGHAFHTSRWDYGYTAGDESGNLTGLEDRTVGIIGTGATALQCVPHLGAWAKRLYVFQRTPSSVDERGNRPTDPEWAKTLRPGWQRERMENFAALTTGGQQPVDLVNDGWTDIMRSVSGGGVTTDPHELQRAEMTKMEMTRRRVDRIVKDPNTASALKPYYHYFCKRPGFHDEYLETFNRPNVTLVDTKGRGVERITAHGAVVEGKEYPLDLLIFGTGFDYLRDYAKESGVDPVGQGELRLSEHWNEGARTLYGMQTRGFPNFFLLSVIQAGGSINYVHVADEQACHIAHIIDRCRTRGIEAVQPTQEAENNWVEEVLSLATARRAFYEACTPGYYNFEGKRGRAQQLNDFYYGKPMAYLNMLKEFRAGEKLSGQELIGERSNTAGPP